MADRSLRIKLLADTSSYRSEMERASRLGNNYYKSANNSSQRLTQYLNQNTAAFAGLNKNIQTATATLKTFAGAFLGGFAVSSVINVADSYGQMAQRIKNSLQSVEGDFSSYEIVQKRLLDTSIRNAKELADSQELYIRSAESMRDLGYNTSQTLDFVESLSSAFTSNATSSDKVKSSIDALNKAFVSGRVSAQQWQTLSAAMPNLAGEIAKSLKKPREEIVKLGNEGKLSVRELANGTILAKDSFNALADSMDNTVKDGFVQLSNAFQGWIGEANQTHKVTATLVQGMTYLAKNFDIVVNSGTALIALSLARYFGGLSTSILSAASASIKASAEARNRALAQKQLLSVNLANIQAEKQNAIVAQASLAAQFKLAQTEKTREAIRAQIKANTAQIIALDRAEAASKTDLAAATKRASLASTALSNAQNLLKSGLNLIGGPTGAAMLAGGALLYFMNQAKEARKEALELAGGVDALIEKYKTLTTAGKQVFLNNLTEDIKKNADVISDIDKEIKKLEARKNPTNLNLAAAIDTQKINEEIKVLKDQRNYLEETLEAKKRFLEQSQKEINESQGKGGTVPADTKAYDEQIARLNKLLEKKKELTEYETIRSEIEIGSLKNLTPLQKEELENLAKKIDLLKQQEIIEAERQKRAAEGESFAEKEIFNQKSPLEKINIEEQQKLDLLNQWKETGLANEATYQEALTAIEQSAAAQRKKILDDEAEAKIANTQALLSATSSLFGGLADITKTFSGEQSQSYKALFAVEKGFAIANAALSLQTAIANAWKLSYPANIPAIGQAIAAGSQVASAISSISYGGGRLNGGEVNRDSFYKITEDGRPEIFQSGGEQYLLPGSNGNIVSNKDISMLGGTQGWTINITNNANADIQTTKIDNEAKIIEIAVSKAKTEVASGIRNKNGEVWNALNTTTNVKARL